MPKYLDKFAVFTKEGMERVVEGFNSTFDKINRAFSAYDERCLEVDIEV